MAYEIHLEREGRLLRVRYSGQVGIHERTAAAQAAFKRAAPAGINRFLLDYRSATYLPGDAAAGQALARYIADQLHGRDARVAWLVTYDHQLGPSVEQHTGELGIINRRFYEMDAAVSWLMQSGEADPPHTGSDPHAPSPPRRALALAMEAADPMLPLPPVQFAAIAQLAQELLDEGLDEAKVLGLARRMFEIVYGGRVTPAPFSSPRD